jgi:hypothetical protein
MFVCVCVPVTTAQPLNHEPLPFQLTGSLTSSVLDIEKDRGFN